LANHTAGKSMNQIDNDEYPENMEEDEPITSTSKWVYRLLALFLLLVFLVPLLIRTFFIVQSLIQPEVQPTPVFFDKIFHG
jgi:hypothetical protein